MANYSEKVFNARSKIYDNIRKNNIKPIYDSGILLKYKLSEKDILGIKNQIKKIILKSLKIWHKKKFKDIRNYLHAYEKEIFQLPNIVPSGTMQPKKEIAKDFSRLHLLVVRLLKKLELLQHIEKGAFIGVRLKKGEKLKTKTTKSKRKYATTTIHSDAWNGQTSDGSIILMIGGDIKNNCIKFYEPINIKKNFLKKKKSFKLGNSFYEKLNYLGESKKNQLAIFDQLCLHNTSYQSASPKSRVSIDCNIHWKNKSKKNYFDKRSKRYNYFNLKKWSTLDYTKIQGGVESRFNDTFAETASRFKKTIQKYNP